MARGYCGMSQFIRGCGRVRNLITVNISRGLKIRVCRECAEEFAKRHGGRIVDRRAASTAPGAISTAPGAISGLARELGVSEATARQASPQSAR